MDWKRITVVGEVEPGELDSHTGRTPLTFRLSAVPPEEWSAFLVRAFEEQGRRRHWREMGVPMPTVQGSRIHGLVDAR